MVGVEVGLGSFDRGIGELEDLLVILDSRCPQKGS
jgi:alpha/beta superfamily hydrolase